MDADREIIRAENKRFADAVGALYTFPRQHGGCGNCWSDFPQPLCSYPTTSSTFEEWSFGRRVAEFGEPLCEWLTNYRCDVTEFMTCPHCGSGRVKRLTVFDDRQKAEAYFATLPQLIAEIA